jgi:putative acetyltransferase
METPVDRHRVDYPPRDPADIAAIRSVNVAAFPTAAEADLVDALRADTDAWIPGLSVVAQAPDGTVVGHALLTRCDIDRVPALVLASCAVLLAYQRQGAGPAAIRTALAAARATGETSSWCSGTPTTTPGSASSPASRWGIRRRSRFPMRP